MTLPHHIEHAVTIAAAERRLGKAFRWSERKVIPGFTEHQNLSFEQSGPAGQWVEDGTTAQTKLFQYGEYVCDSLERRLKLRELLSTVGNLALVTGALNDDLRSQLVPHADNYGLPGMYARNKRILVDRPRGFLTLDLDKLDLSEAHDYDSVFEANDRLPSIIHDMFDEAGLSWLICDSVMTLSSSHGIRNPKVMGVHLDYQLRTPLLLSEQKHVVNYINQQARKAGIVKPEKSLCDTTIYESARLLFTAPAELRVYVENGKSTVTKLVSVPYQRVRAVRRGQPYLEDIPEEAMRGVITAQKMAKVRSITGVSGHADSHARKVGRQAAGVKEESRKLVPGRIHANTNARIWAAVNNTPIARLEGAKQALSEQLIKEVMAICDGDAGKTEQRLRVVSGDEFERSWRGAVDNRLGYAVVADMTNKHKSGASVPATREALNKHMSACIKRAIKATEANEEDKQPPVHTLFKIPPGIGKTHAALGAIPSELLMAHRLSYLTPRIDLSTEALSRMRERLPKDDYTQSRARQHLGREAVCLEKNRAYGRMAKRLEEVGVSPLKPVCWSCPSKDACRWPQQHADKESGIVFGQHAHATSSLAKIRKMDGDGAPSVGIIDESMLSTLVRSSLPTYKISTLMTWAKKGVMKTRSGDTMFGKTNDLIAYRCALLEAMQTADAVLKTDQLKRFRTYETTHKDGTTRTLPQIAWAMELERDNMWSLNHQLTDVMKTYHEARAKRRGVREIERSLSVLRGLIRSCNWFSEAFRAVKGSLEVENRQHVFGVRVRKDKRGDRRVSITLKAELPAVMRERSWIWLDGTANEHVWQYMLPAGVTASRVALEAAEGPYRLIQFADRPYGKRMFATGEARGKGNADRLMGYIRAQAIRHDKVLLVCQKHLREYYETNKMLPANVAALHFNAQRGRDDFREYGCAIIVGRPMPNVEALEILTEALHYDDPETPALTTAADHKNREPRNLKLTGQREVTVMAETHPDARVAAMLSQIADSEVLQAVHRLRLYDRTDANPAEVHVLGQTNTGLVISELRGWVDTKTDQLDEILVLGMLPSDTLMIERLYPNFSLKRARNLISEARKLTVHWPERAVIIRGQAGVFKLRVDPTRGDGDVLQKLSKAMKGHAHWA